MSVWIAVALGGSLGSVIRLAFADWYVGKFPAGIFAVNIAGCFLIGLVEGCFRAHGWPSPIWRSFIITGVIGAFTTFSTFGLQAVDLTQKKAWSTSIVYVAGSVFLGLLAVWIGLKCGSIGAVESNRTL